MPRLLADVPSQRDDRADAAGSNTVAGRIAADDDWLLDSPAGEVSEWLMVPLSKSGVR